MGVQEQWWPRWPRPADWLSAEVLGGRGFCLLLDMQICEPIWSTSRDSGQPRRRIVHLENHWLQWASRAPLVFGRERETFFFFWASFLSHFIFFLSRMFSNKNLGPNSLKCVCCRLARLSIWMQIGIFFAPLERFLAATNPPPPRLPAKSSVFNSHCCQNFEVGKGFLFFFCYFLRNCSLLKLETRRTRNKQSARM